MLAETRDTSGAYFSRAPIIRLAFNEIIEISPGTGESSFSGGNNNPSEGILLATILAAHFRGNYLICRCLAGNEGK